jgi:hypothetical protein
MEKRPGCPSKVARPFYLRVERGNNMNEIDPDFLPDLEFEGNPEFDKFLKEWDVEMCECKGEPPLGYRLGTCKICNRGEGMIYVSKKTGKKYWTDKEDDKYLIPRIPMTDKEKKYGQNWMRQLQMCPRCCEAVTVFMKIEWRSSTDYNDKIEIHCQKCRQLGHKDGTYIKTVDWLTIFRIPGKFSLIFPPEFEKKRYKRLTQTFV